MIDGFQGVAEIQGETGREVHSFEDLKTWLESRKESQKVSISRITLKDCTPWFYDEDSGQIRNPTRSFFQIAGIHSSFSDGRTIEQPIILQNEIGFLGIICKKINGIWHFLMQAKIEPGNINYVQISPTIQATKSNFMRLHGGREPEYLPFFTQMTPENVLVDQIQSEQSSRFLGKRNRNVILKTEEEIEEADSFRWMTMHQLKTFMAIDNCVNMDTRTVLSCIPYVFLDEPMEGHTKEFIDSINTIDRNAIRDLYIHINDYKLSNLCAALSISRRTYYKYRNKEDPDYYDYLLIKDVFDQSKSTYGYRRVSEGLKIKYGVIFNHKKVARIMKKYNLKPEYMKRIRPNVSAKIFKENVRPDLVKRHFKTKALNQI